MTTSLIVVCIGAIVAAVGTGVLTARCARTPRLFLVAWTVAIFALTIALGAQALGYLSGYSDVIFRAMELGGQAIAPLALCLGLVELVGRGVPARFAMRLAVSAIAVIVLVILGADPLNPNATFGTSWADPSVFYELVPKGLIEFLAVFTVVTALVAGLVAMIRSSRDRASQDMAQPTLAIAGAATAVALPGIAMALHLPLPGHITFALTGILAAALIWLAGRAAEHRGLTGYHGADDHGRRADGYGEEDDIGGPGRSAHRGDRYDDRDAAADYLSNGYRGDASRTGRDAAGTGQPYVDSDADFGYPALAELAAEPDRYQDPGHYGDRYDDGSFGLDTPYGSPDRYGEPELFGQITIYTLIDDRIDDFDRLTERLVQLVRAGEPGTLVYIVHAVPTAPMQRILYEVYQDRRAYDEHLIQPHVARYEGERRRCVLATNVIELGLQQAKVSPLPTFSAISDILSESGIDLTGITKSPRAGTQATNVVRSPRGSVPVADPAYSPRGPRDVSGSDAGYSPRGPRDVSGSDAGYSPREPRDVPRPEPGPGRHGSDRAGPQEPGYEGWAEIRREDPRYR